MLAIVDAASPEATSSLRTPALVSIRYANAPAVAAPPGTTLPTAPLASCDVPTANQLVACSATRCIAHSDR